jgi:hypothetical protein
MKHLKLTLLTLLLPLVAFAAPPVIEARGTLENSYTAGTSWSAVVGRPERYSIQVQGNYNDTRNTQWSIIGDYDGCDGLGIPTSMRSSSVQFNGAFTEAGTCKLKLRATNTANEYTDKEFTITITNPDAPNITNTSPLSGGEVGLWYSTYIDASTSYAKYSIASGSLPAGLELSYVTSGIDAGKARISGYPTTAVNARTFTLKAENISNNVTKQFSITIAAETAKPELPYEYEDGKNYYELDGGNEGDSYSHFIDVNRAATLNVASGLPLGLKVMQDEYGQWFISGYPTKAGTYNFTLNATNTKGTNSKVLRIEVNAATETPELEEGIYIPYDEIYAGKEYLDWDFVAQLYTSNYVGGTWDVKGLPPGLAVRSEGASAYIIGTPTTAGTYPVKVKVSNTAGTSDEIAFNLSVLMPRTPQFEPTQTLPDAKVGMIYSEDFWTDTEYAKYSIASGSLPPGLKIEEEYGHSYIYGTPTTAGNYTFTVRATNASGTATKQFTIRVTAPKVPTITTTSLPNAKVGLRYGDFPSIRLEAADNATWSLYSGILPAGLTLNRNGNISGTPTTASTSTFTVKAQNPAGSSTKELSITVVTPAKPIIADMNPPIGKRGLEYNLWLQTKADRYGATAEDGDRATSWSVAMGTLPTGLTLNSSSGYISGIPTATGTSVITVKATNAGGDSEENKSLTIIIQEPVKPVITTTSLPNGKVGSYYQQELRAADDATWSIASGTLPLGLRLERGSSYSYIYGTPSIAGTSTFTVKATNLAGNDTKQFSIVITSSSSGGGSSGGSTGGCIESCSGYKPPTTPVLSKVETGNKAVHIANGLNLSVSSGAVVGIYGLKGNLVQSQSYASGEHTMSLNNLPKGMYIVKVSFRNRENTLSHSDVMKVTVK